MVKKKLTNFIYELGLMKMVEREGWRYAGIRHPETIAEHSLRASQIAFILAKLENADPYRASAIALFHEIGEIRIGDIHKVANRYIIAEEERAVQEQTNKLGSIGKEIFDLWKQAEHKTTKEGIIAKDADLLELIFTALEYKSLGYATDDWIKNAVKQLRTKSAKLIAKQAKALDPFSWWKGLKIINKKR